MRPGYLLILSRIRLPGPDGKLCPDFVEASDSQYWNRSTGELLASHAKAAKISSLPRQLPGSRLDEIALEDNQSDYYLVRLAAATHEQKQGYMHERARSNPTGNHSISLS